jgi:hypothetical protein
MPPDEICYWPSRFNQVAVLAGTFLVFVFSFVGFIILWLLDPDQIQDHEWRVTLVGIYPVLLILLAILAVGAVVCGPIMLVMLVWPAPVLALTAKGMRLRGTPLLRWEEIEEIHEYRHNLGLTHQMLIGLYFRDEEATRARLGRLARWNMSENKRQGRPPIVVATQHLQQTTAEILDDIEEYLDELRRDTSKKRKLPKVFRRQD